MEDKTSLRKLFLKKRLALNHSEINLLSNCINQQFIDIYNKYKWENIHIFLPISSKKEFDTFPIIDFLINKNITLWTSKVINKDKLLHTKIYKEYKNNLEWDKWEIPIIKGIYQDKIENLDCVVIPMIVGDKYGARIGYGKGFYDKFLENYPNTYKLGISFLKYEKKLPQDKNDIPLDDIIFSDKN